MAGRGAPPKPDDERARRNATVPMTAVEPDAELRGPELPETAADWPARTRQWWDTWRKSPQAQTFTDTDWDFLLDTTMIHAEFVTGAVSLAGELRLRVAKFGATPEDRMRLRLSVKPAAAGGPGVAPAAPRAAESPDRRERLLKAVQ